MSTELLGNGGKLRVLPVGQRESCFIWEPTVGQATAGVGNIASRLGFTKDGVHKQEVPGPTVYECDTIDKNAADVLYESLRPYNSPGDSNVSRLHLLSTLQQTGHTLTTFNQGTTNLRVLILKDGTYHGGYENVARALGCTKKSIKGNEEAAAVEAAAEADEEVEARAEDAMLPLVEATAAAADIAPALAAAGPSTSETDAVALTMTAAAAAANALATPKCRPDLTDMTEDAPAKKQLVDNFVRATEEQRKELEDESKAHEQKVKVLEEEGKALSKKRKDLEEKHVQLALQLVNKVFAGLRGLEAAVPTLWRMPLLNARKEPIWRLWVGLLVGKPNVGSRALLFSVIRTPQQDGRDAMECTVTGAPAPSKGPKAKGGAGGGALVQLDVAWVAEHGVQVSRMLPGGLSVIGAYVFCPEAGYQSALEPLAALLSELSKQQGAPKQPLLMLHVDSASRKMSLREGDGAAPLRTAKPIELKFSPCISQLVCLTCCHHVEVCLPVAADSQQLKERLGAAVAAEGRRISQSMVLLPGGTLPSDAALVMDAIPGAADAMGADVPACSVSLLTPLGSGAPAPTASSSSSGGLGASTSEVQGRVTLRGQLHGVAFVTKREAVGKAVEQLKSDLQASLRYRMDLLVEDAYSWEEEQREAAGGGEGAAQPQAPHPLLRKGKQGMGAAFALPMRVLMPWVSGLSVCDYLLPGEGPEAAAERAAELLTLELAGGAAAVQQPETAARVPAAVATWVPGVGSSSGKSAQPAKVTGLALDRTAGESPKPAACASYALLGGAAAAAVAALATAFSLMGSQ
ncbi:hypothetical protein FOA52_004927 [Chlamydomonas sp. UWO 241]|nr:hypothetical protein FOA52_004927 [Chlamydomonas sp. UWO 241]